MKSHLIQRLARQTVSSLLLAFFVSQVDAGQFLYDLSQASFSNRDLTAEGNLDWAVWGFANKGASTSLSPDVRKSGGHGISDLTDVTNGNPLQGLGQFGDTGQSTFDWSDGDSTPTATNAFTGISHLGGSASTDGEGFSFTAEADNSLRVLKLYTTTHQGYAQLNARLSDLSAPGVIFPLIPLSDDASYVFTFQYAADSPGETLNVFFRIIEDNSTNNSAYVAIQAVSLSTGLLVPESYSGVLLAFTTVPFSGMAFRGVRRRI